MHIVLFIYRTTVLIAAIVFGIKWNKEKKRADELQRQLAEAQKQPAEAEAPQASDTEESEDQPLDYEQRTAQQKYLLEQFFWATVRRLFKGSENPLTPRECKIVYQILIGRRLKDIGADMTLTEGRVREIWEKALRRWENYGSELRQKEAEIESLNKRIRELEIKLCGAIPPELLSSPLGAFDDLSPRALNFLKGAELETVADLVKLQRADLLKSRNVGKRLLAELETWLEQHGLSLGMNV